MAGFIGARASVVSSGAERKQTYAITTTTTSLTGLAYTPTKVHVYHNGIRLVDGTDYTATDGTSITLTTAAENGDEVVVISYATFQTSDTVSAANGGTFAGNVAFNNSVSVGTEAGTYDLDIKKNIAQDQIVRVGSEGGGGRTIMFADVLDTPTKYNFQVGAQSNVNNGFEITPSTTVGGTTFTNPALVINENGYVTKPTQPMFAVVGNNPTYVPISTHGGGNPVPFPTVLHNVGNHYDASTYRFTAPVSGKYFFTSTVYTRSGHNNSIQDIYTRWILNGSSNRGYVYWYQQTNAGLRHHSLVDTLFIDLSENDYLELVIYGSATAEFYNGPEECRLSGWLFG